MRTIAEIEADLDAALEAREAAWEALSARDAGQGEWHAWGAAWKRAEALRAELRRTKEAQR